MKKSHRYLIYGLIAILMLSIKWVTDHQLSYKINQVIKTVDGNPNVGILVADAQTGKVLYKKNADRYFAPASNEKLFTAYAALQFLGTNFVYQTNLFVDTSKIRNGVLNDNAYLQFSGDPSFTIEQLDRLIAALSKAGVKQFNGNIVVDDTAFDQSAMSVGTTWDDQDYCWGSPISAMTVDHNCVTAAVKPATQIDQPAVLTLPEHTQSMQFINQVITRAATTTDCKVNVKRSNAGTYTINGCIKLSDQPNKIEMAVNSSRENIKVLLPYLLKKNNILGNYQIVFNKPSVLPNLLASENSPNMQALVTKMLKESDNTIANSVFKTLGARYANQAGGFDNGGDAVRDIIAKSIQLDIPKSVLIDGDGASRYNYFTPLQIVTLLQRIYLSSNAKIFISALPVAGADGTIKSRMSDIGGKVFAKTGTETGVTALSGYIETNKKHTLVFSIMINNFIDMPSKYEELEDKICKVLALT